MSDREIWKEAVGFEGMCIVSSKGKVIARRYLKDGALSEWASVNPFSDNNGYEQVWLTKKNGERRVVRVHRLVAEAFIPNFVGKRIVNHKDGDKSNNSIENLEWNTYKENLAHAWSKGLNNWPKRVIDSNRTIYESITEAGRAYGRSQSTMSKIVNGGRTIDGVRFEVIS